MTWNYCRAYLVRLDDWPTFFSQNDLIMLFGDFEGFSSYHLYQQKVECERLSGKCKLGCTIYLVDIRIGGGH